MCVGFGHVINSFGKFGFHLGNVTAASEAALPNPTGVCGVVVFARVPGEGYNSRHNSSTAQSYWCMWRFSVYLGMTTTTTRVVVSRPASVWCFGVYLGKDTAALPSFTGVCGVSVFTWVQLLQPQE